MPLNSDADGYYVSPVPRDLSLGKIYAALNAPHSKASITTHWSRGDLAGFTEEWTSLLHHPAEIACFAEQGLRFRYPEQIEDYLDQGHVLRTTDRFYRRDRDNTRPLAPAPADWRGPWLEVI